MKWKEIKYEIIYYPHRVWKYKTLWLWGERMRKVRQKAKRDKYRGKRYCRLRARARILRENVKQCKVCGSDKQLQVHHIIPVSLGGKNNIENLMVVCNNCHLKIHK